MKKVSKLIAVSLGILLIFVCVVPSVAHTKTSASELGTSNALLFDQTGAINADICLHEAFAQDREGEYVYPSNYGGRYIDGNKLIVCLTDDSADTRAWYEDVLKDYEQYYSFKLVEYPISELYDGRDELVIHLESEGVEVVQYAVDQKSNGIYIGVIESDVTEAISIATSSSAYSSKINCIPIEIQSAQYSMVESTTLNGGNKIYNDSCGDVFSIGVCGTYDGGSALLTCGHNFQGVGDLIKYNSSSGDVIGSVVHRNLYSGSTGDYEIISVTNNQYITSYRIAGNKIVHGTYSNPAQGVYLYKYGQASGTSSGYIQTTDMTIKLKLTDTVKYSVHGMTEVKLDTGSTAGGDSGGPYYVPANSSLSTNYVLFAGIHSSSVTDTTGTYVYFTPWGKISSSGFIVETY